MELLSLSFGLIVLRKTRWVTQGAGPEKREALSPPLPRLAAASRADCRPRVSHGRAGFVRTACVVTQDSMLTRPRV